MAEKDGLNEQKNEQKKEDINKSGEGINQDREHFAEIGQKGKQQSPGEGNNRQQQDLNKEQKDQSGKQSYK